ncbi:MAG: hypothetical protein MZV49_13000, partial [Rhodopseudomonas palustris]|nr:hypothetical protein [Rhodopseudomonas palustris]
MDTSVDPRRDFARYAAGRWLDVATIPGDSPYISGIVLMNKRVERQVNDLLADAAGKFGGRQGHAVAAGGRRLCERHGRRAPRETGRRTAHAAVGKDREDRRAEVARLGTRPPRTDHQHARGDRRIRRHRPRGPDPLQRGGRRWRTAAPRARALPVAPTRPVREAYLKVIADSLALAGVPPAEGQDARAGQGARDGDAHRGQEAQPPVQKRDVIRAAFNRMSYAEPKAAAPRMDFDTLFTALGLPPSGEVLVADIGAVRERDAMLGGVSARGHQGVPAVEVLKKVVGVFVLTLAIRN